MSSTVGKSTLTALSGVRFVAAVHILLFHIAEGERVAIAAGDTPPYRLFADLPVWLSTIIHRGYCSTSFFFLLSGIVLAYLYLDAEGQLATTPQKFLTARFTRLYPFHAVVLVLLAILVLPVVTYLWWSDPQTLANFQTPLGGTPSLFGRPLSPPLYLTISCVLNLLLIQAWFPEFALSGNFATWALSTVAFFYIVFPRLGPWLARLERRVQWMLLALAPFVSLLPTLVYMQFEEASEQLTLASEFLFRFPPFWLAHFVMGILVTRLARLSRHPHPAAQTEPSSPTSRSRQPSLGDIALGVAIVLMAIPDARWSSWLRLSDGGPHFLFRHGALAPLFIVMAFDFARGRGWASWLLSASWLQRLGAATYSVFILQIFFMVVAVGIAFLPLPSLARLIAIVLVTAALTWLADRYVDQPLVRKVKQFLS
ncbi:MAG: acyltransferase [Pirellulales bacterium]